MTPSRFRLRRLVGRIKPVIAHAPRDPLRQARLARALRTKADKTGSNYDFWRAGKC
jgi:hypothetical protein